MRMEPKKLIKRLVKKRNKSVTNLSLRNKAQGAEIAKKRYGISFSELVDQLIALEYRREGGVLGKKFVEELT